MDDGGGPVGAGAPAGEDRSRRPRRAALGEPGTIPGWKTGRREAAHFDPRRRDERFRDNENRRAMMAYLRRHGRPLACTRIDFGQSVKRAATIARALSELGIELLAGSPQAKGRVERPFGTAGPAGEGDAHRRDTLNAANRSRGAGSRSGTHASADGAATRTAPFPGTPIWTGSSPRPRIRPTKPALAPSRHVEQRLSAAPVTGTSRSSPCLGRQGAPAASRRSTASHRRSRPSGRLPPGPTRKTIPGSPPRRSRHDHRWLSQASNEAPGNRNGKAPARAVLNSAASR